jgi:putative YphP/YqiW family bacilliredoxin
MPYPEILIKPMRDELTQLGVQETRTPEQVDAAVQQPGTVMVIVNSVCGCAAGKARPGIAMALQNKTLPDRIVTVFAGGDIEATDHARSYFKGYPPSSPSVGLLRDGELVYILQRHQIEGREAPQIASELTAAFDRFCTKAKV